MSSLNFKDFKITTEATDNFIGDKIPIERLLNIPIEVFAFKVSPSKFHQGTELLTLQIEKNRGEKRVVFTGGKYLIQQIRQVPSDGFPFKTTIVKVDQHLEFT